MVPCLAQRQCQLLCWLCVGFSVGLSGPCICPCSTADMHWEALSAGIANCHGRHGQHDGTQKLNLSAHASAAGPVQFCPAFDACCTSLIARVLHNVAIGSEHLCNL